MDCRGVIALFGSKRGITPGVRTLLVVLLLATRPDVIQAAVFQDRIEPGIEGLQGFQPRHGCIGLRERLLAQVLGRGTIAEQAHCVIVRFATILLHQELKATRVALLQAQADGSGFVHRCRTLVLCLLNSLPPEIFNPG